MFRLGLREIQARSASGVGLRASLLRASLRATFCTRVGCALPITRAVSENVTARNALTNPKLTYRFTGTFTVLNPVHNEQTPAELKLQMDAVPRSYVMEHAVPMPPRSVLHETITTAALTTKAPTESHFRHVVSHCYAKALAMTKARQSEYDRLDSKATTLANESLLRVKKGVCVTADDKRVQALLKTVNTNAQFSTSSTAAVDDVVATVARNDLRREYRKDLARQTVAQVFTDEFEAGRMQPFERVKTKFGYTVVVMGGAATGKSTLTKDILCHYRDAYGISPEDFSFLSTDRNRLPLLDDPSLGTDKSFHGDLTQEEASYITDMQFERRRQMAAQGWAIHSLIEKVYVGEHEVDLMSCGTKLRVYATFCCPATAIHNDHARFLAHRERSVPREYILSGQKLASNSLHLLLKKPGEDIAVEIHDTQLRMSGQKVLPCAYINLQKKRLYVLNLASLLEFVKRSELNVNATHQCTLYSPKETTVEACIQKLLAKYGHLEVVFVKPEADKVDMQNLDQSRFAHYTASRGLVVDKQGVFNKLTVKEKAMFAALSDTVSSNTPKPATKK